ncbi:uncharacterized protein LOC142097037 isoform X2 [Mixophyes fleayi]|uniref:uncharacterized protein LOC142097037 isoform X2 n=1 Tax=Mixophyes fleayi TaxID=3061075 RepID=UPI003F4DA113
MHSLALIPSQYKSLCACADCVIKGCCHNYLSGISPTNRTIPGSTTEVFNMGGGVWSKKKTYQILDETLDIDEDHSDQDSAQLDIGRLSAHRTPVHLLYEYAARRGLSPVYMLEMVEGPSHQPLFKYSVTIANLTCTGEGPKKTTAKHRAAEALLNTISSENSHGKVLQDSKRELHSLTKGTSGEPSTSSDITPTERAGMADHEERRHLEILDILQDMKCHQQCLEDKVDRLVVVAMELINTALTALVVENTGISNQ